VFQIGGVPELASTYLRYAILGCTTLLFIGLWWAVADLKHDYSQFAGPLQTSAAIENTLTNPVLRGQVISALGVTLESIFVGFALAVVIGIPVGVIMGRFLVADLFLDPWVNAWYSIPAIAFVPLVMNFTGLNYAGSIVIAFLIAVFSIILNVYSGIKNCNKTLVDTALSYRASEFQVMSKVLLPASLPNIMVGLRLGISRAIEGVIIAEMFFAAVGLGGMIDYSADHLQSATSDALIIYLAVLSLILTALLRIVDRKLVVWKESEAMNRV
jgi:ABC-type nitrate/sulfonate/bicarbonate transport system permease component